MTSIPPEEFDYEPSAFERSTERFKARTILRYTQFELEEFEYEPAAFDMEARLYDPETSEEEMDMDAFLEEYSPDSAALL